MAGKKDSGGKATGKKAAVPKKRGRPRVTTDAMKDEFCEIVSSGGTDAEAASEVGVSASTIRRERKRDADFCADSMRAQDARIQEHEERVNCIPKEVYAVAQEKDINEAKARVLNISFNQSFRLLQVYKARFRERKAVELTGAEGKDLIPPANDELLREALAASREKLAAMERERREREDGTGS